MADQFTFGTSDPVMITETGHKFMVDFINGQKTGFFLDQRSNGEESPGIGGGGAVHAE